MSVITSTLGRVNELSLVSVITSTLGRVNELSLVSAVVCLWLNGAQC